MADLEFHFYEAEIKKIITDFYWKKLGRIVSVALNKKKTRAGVTKKYEPYIDFSIIDTIDIGGIKSYTITTLDSSTLNTILAEYFASEGLLVNEVLINASINRKIRKKDNVVFEDIKVSCDSALMGSDLGLDGELSEEDMYKLNNGSVVFNSREISDLIKEYCKLYRNSDAEVSYVPRFKENDMLNDHYFLVKEKVIIDGEERESSSYMDEETLKCVVATLLKDNGYELNSFYLNNLLAIDADYDYVTPLLKLYLNVTKKIDIATLSNVNNIEDFENFEKQNPVKKKKKLFDRWRKR